ALNRMGVGPLTADLSGPSLRRSSLRGIAAVVADLGVDAAHVVFGHTHRPGPLPHDAAAEWKLPGGGTLVNTGGWGREPSFLGAQSAARPAPESGHRLGGLTGGHQLLDHRDRQDLAGLLLPDHEAAAGVVLAPARVPLPVLDHVAAADGARSEVGPLDLHVLQ